MNSRGEIGELDEFRIGEEELMVEWRIREVLSLPGGSDDRYTSPEFRVGDDRWWLSMWPSWKRQARIPSSGWVRLGLRRYDAGPLKTFRISAGIRESGGVKRSRGVEDVWGYDYYDCDDFCSRSELMEHKTRLMPDGVFTVTCFLRRIVTGAARGVCSLPHSSTQEVPTIRSQSSDKRGCEKLQEDFAKLLASGEKSDVTVQVDDVEFKVHSAILFARSPALSASLQHESKEKASNRIVIEDCEPDVFKDFLQYLYAGFIQSLTERNVFGLYRVADKYLADDLKQQCLEHMRDTLCVQTFCDTVKLALMHAESGLLQLAMDFAIKNIHSIIISSEWQNFICEYPREANEILIKCFGKRVPS